MINEATLKSELVRRSRIAMPTFVIERHEDRYTHGIPDIGITGNKKNSRWEVKHATPGFKVKGVQELTMLRLDLANYARFIVYWEKNEVKRTYIVKPSDISKSIDEWSYFQNGFDHDWVVSIIQGVHSDTK